MVERDHFLDYAAKLLEGCFLVVSVATANNEAGSAADVAAVLRRPLDNLRIKQEKSANLHGRIHARTFADEADWRG